MWRDWWKWSQQYQIYRFWLIVEEFYSIRNTKWWIRNIYINTTSLQSQFFQSIFKKMRYIVLNTDWNKNTQITSWKRLDRYTIIQLCRRHKKIILPRFSGYYCFSIFNLGGIQHYFWFRHLLKSSQSGCHCLGPYEWSNNCVNIHHFLYLFFTKIAK